MHHIEWHMTVWTSCFTMCFRNTFRSICIHAHCAKRSRGKGRQIAGSFEHLNAACAQLFMEGLIECRVVCMQQNGHHVIRMKPF